MLSLIVGEKNYYNIGGFMLTPQLVWIITESLSFTITTTLLLNKQVSFRFNSIICSVIYAITCFTAYIFHTVDIVNNQSISFFVISFDFLILCFYVITTKEFLYRSMITIMLQNSAHSVLYSLVGLIIMHFFPTASPNQLTSFEQILPYSLLKIAYILTFIYIYKKSSWFHKLIFSIPLSVIFIPYQTISFVANNYTGRTDNAILTTESTTFVTFFIINCFTFLIFIFSMFFFTNKNSLNNKLFAKENLVNIQKAYIENLDSTFKTAAKFRHDLNNYISILTTLNKSGQQKESNTYQHMLLSTCDNLISEFHNTAPTKTDDTNNLSSTSSKLNSIFKIIDNSNLISSGLFIIHFFCNDFIFKQESPFVVPAYILLFLTTFIFYIRKKANKHEVQILSILFLFSVILFALQAKFDSLLLATISMVGFFIILLLRHYRKFEKSTQIRLCFTVIIVSIAYLIITLKYKNLLYTLIFLGIFTIIISLSIFFQTKLLKKNIQKKEAILIEYEKTIDNAEIFSSAFVQLKKELLDLDSSKYDTYEILNTYDFYFSQFDTPSSIINSILSSKYQRCLNLDIQLHTDIEVLSNICTDELSIGRLLFNLLDNAIEASLKASTHPRKINLSIKSKANYLFINVSNSKNKQDFPIKNKMISSKKNMGHGLGLLIIQDIVETYQGSIDMEDCGSYFVSKVFLDLDFNK
jgi:hypothetical protein